MSVADRKRRAAEAALEYVVPGAVLGVGTGSTVDLLIESLAAIRDRVPGALASSRATEQGLRRVGIPIVDPNDCDAVPVYIDGADESDRRLRLIKGGGGALTREKILASMAERFVCIADASKLVDRLGAFPLPVEVLPLAVRQVARRLAALGGDPVVRDGYVTDNGNPILDVAGLDLSEPDAVESALNDIPGVVCNGLFALRPADVLLLGTADGVERLP